MNKLVQALLILAIIVTALFGLGFGLCGAWGMTAALGGAGESPFVFMLALTGLLIAAVAGAFIRFVLWKNLQRRWRRDDEDRRD